MEKFVAYYRVSTVKQKESGLGIDSQVQFVERYVKSIGGYIMHEYKEYKSGARKKSRIKIMDKTGVNIDTLLRNRPLLLKAIERCIIEDLTLIVYDSVRLGRDSLLIGWLIESDLRFVLAITPDEPAMITMQKAIYSEEERNQLSKNTKKGLDLARARGVKLGVYSHKRRDYRFCSEQRTNSIQVRMRDSLTNSANKNALEIILIYREDMNPPLPYDQIAKNLNAKGFRTITGQRWRLNYVYALYQRHLKYKQQFGEIEQSYRN